MSDRVRISAQPRLVAEKKAKQLRREGWIPAVIYGQTEPVHIQVENGPLRRVLRTAGATSLIDVSVADATYTVLAREIQQHVTRGDLVHVDFLEVDLKATVRAIAQLKAVGQSAPGAEGMGVAVLALRMVEIECLPEALVEEVEVDMSRIETADDVLYVADLVVPKGVAIVTDGETVVARFEWTKEVEEEEVEEEFFVPAADDVEVIGKSREDEEDFEE